jgi:hypothetical protein
VATAVVNGAATGAAVAGSVAAVGDGGAETVAAPAGSARLETGTSALGESFWDKSDKSVVMPIPTTREKMTNPDSASTASTKALTHAIFIFGIGHLPVSTKWVMS